MFSVAEVTEFQKFGKSIGQTYPDWKMSMDLFSHRLYRNKCYVDLTCQRIHIGSSDVAWAPVAIGYPEQH